jgi:hypothetical protein
MAATHRAVSETEGLAEVMDFAGYQDGRGLARLPDDPRLRYHVDCHPAPREARHVPRRKTSRRSLPRSAPCRGPS